MVGKKFIPLTPDDFKLNQLAEIIVNEEGYKGVYASRIEEVNDTTLTLAMPFYRGQIVPLRPGLNIKVSFSKERIVYSFETTILKRVRPPLPLLIVKKPVEAERRQRRAWVRIELSIPVKYRRWKLGDSLQSNSDSTADFTETSSIDISGGGMMFTTNEKLQQGDLLFVSLEIPDFGPLNVKSRITRISRTPPAAKAKYFVGVEFLDLRENDQDRIVKIVFDRQRELIKKGLL
jgi:c-di-GMP-binding flagellar brake protein YcgR